MGFEVTYHYKEALETVGEYDEVVLTKTAKIGKYKEDVPLEVLAGKIIAQLARRNILIVDIDIVEFAPKKISYKETSTGILIRNKKFSFDSGAVISESGDSDYDDEDLSAILENEKLLEKIKSAIGPQEPVQKLNLAPRNSKSSSSKSSPPPSSSGKRSLRMEIYDPEITNDEKNKQKGLKFSMGKKYPIYEEKSLGVGGIMNYVTKDDSGKEVEVGSDSFVVPTKGLAFNDDGPRYFGEADSEPNIWGNIQTQDNIPDVRG